MAVQTDYRTPLSTADQMAAAAKAAADAAASAVASAKIAWIIEVTITYTGLIALNLAPKTKNFDVTTAKVGDRVYVHRNGVPQLAGALVGGVMIEGTGYVTADGKVDVYHTIPAVGLNQILTIPLKLIGYRAAA